MNELILKWIMCLLMIGESMLIFHNQWLKSRCKSKVIFSLNRLPFSEMAILECENATMQS